MENEQKHCESTGLVMTSIPEKYICKNCHKIWSGEAPVCIPNPVGRPSDYTQNKADAICEQLALGVSLRSVCKQEDMPSIATVFKWMRTNEEFLKQYARAKQESADAMAEEVLDIADNSANDYMDKQFGETKVRVVDQENIQRSRLRVDTRKWLMSKMKPKKYADKIDVTSGGETIKGNTIVLSDFKNDSESK